VFANYTPVTGPRIPFETEQRGSSGSYQNKQEFKECELGIKVDGVPFSEPHEISRLFVLGPHDCRGAEFGDVRVRNAGIIKLRSESPTGEPGLPAHSPLSDVNYLLNTDRGELLEEISDIPSFVAHGEEADPLARGFGPHLSRKTSHRDGISNAGPHETNLSKPQQLPSAASSLRLSMAKVLVTGGTGFLGSYVTDLLTARGDSVTVTYLVDPNPFLAAIGHRAKRRALDVRDAATVHRVLEEERPDLVFHFAGQPYVQASWEDPIGTFETNIDGTVAILEWIRKSSPRTALAFASSGSIYGISPKQPIDEDVPMRPSSPYAASKAAADLLCYQYHKSYDLRTLRLRFFSTTGPGKEGDAPNDFASQVARVEGGPAPRELKVGSLETRRDITDVRDAVRAMILIADRGDPELAYNVGSGEPRSIRGMVDALLAAARAPITVVQDPTRLRRVDEPVIQADIGRLRALGWSPARTWDQTIRDILDYWREHPPGAGAPA
jgi:GDP-4-dehydro-6-deoxy-D-mannose reductase